MLIGYNNDVEHRGKTFHIQTEDRGTNDDCIETQLFHGGAILDTKITSYTDLVDGLEGDARNKKIKSLMKASHRALFKNLLAGQYDEMVGLDPVEKAEEEVEEISEQFQPGQDRVPQQAVAIEEEGLDALDDAGEAHMGLDQLKDQLSGLKEGGPPAADDEAGSKTEKLDSLPSFESSDRQGGTRRATQHAEVEYPKTGVQAWTGCEEPDEDLSVTELVEDFLGL